jgi:uncharacterized protein
MELQFFYFTVALLSRNMKKSRSSTLLLILIFNCLVTPNAGAQSSPLADAVKDNDLEQARSLLGKGANANSYDDDSDSVLMDAALYATADMMKLLLEQGSDPNASNRDGETPLMWSTNDINKVKILLQCGADINRKAKSGNTALLIASIGYGKYDIIKSLLDNGADAKALNNKKESALMRAALFGDTSTISLLLSKGLDINAQDDAGQTALINSILNVNRLITIQLLDRGADPDLVSGFSLTAVSAAVTYNDTESVIAVLKKAKNIDAPDDGGRTSLMWAAYNEHDNVAIIQALLDKGANVSLKAKDGSTALSWALKKGNTATVALLRRAGAK